MPHFIYGIKEDIDAYNGPVTPATKEEALLSPNGVRKWDDGVDDTTKDYYGNSWTPANVLIRRSGQVHLDRLGQEIVEGVYAVGAWTSGSTSLEIYQIVKLTPLRVKALNILHSGESPKVPSDLIVIDLDAIDAL